MNFLKTIWHLIANFFSGLSKELQTVIIPLAVGVTNALKEFVDLDKGDIIGKIAESFGIGGGIDVENKIRIALTNIVPKLELAQHWLEAGSLDDILKWILADVDHLTADGKTLFWTNFAALLNTDFADGKLTVIESWQAVAYYYKNYPQPTVESIAKSVSELTAQTDNEANTVYVPEAAIAALAPIAPVSTEVEAPAPFVSHVMS